MRQPETPAHPRRTITGRAAAGLIGGGLLALAAAPAAHAAAADGTATPEIPSYDSMIAALPADEGFPVGPMTAAAMSDDASDDSTPAVDTSATQSDPQVAPMQTATQRDAAQSDPRRLHWLSQVPLYPLAGSPVDPTSNHVGAEVAGVPLTSDPVDNAFETGLLLGTMPVFDQVFNVPQD